MLATIYTYRKVFKKETVGINRKLIMMKLSMLGFIQGHCKLQWLGFDPLQRIFILKLWGSTPSFDCTFKV